MNSHIYGHLIFDKEVKTIHQTKRAFSFFLSFLFLKNIYLFIYFIRHFFYIHFKCYPDSSLYPPSILFPYPPTPASWLWHSPVLGHIEHFQQMLLVQLAVCMQKNANRSILISFYKAQIQMDQGPPHKPRYTEFNRKESGEILNTWAQGNISWTQHQWLMF